MWLMVLSGLLLNDQWLCPAGWSCSASSTGRAARFVLPCRCPTTAGFCNRREREAGSSPRPPARSAVQRSYKGSGRKYVARARARKSIPVKAPNFVEQGQLVPTISAKQSWMADKFLLELKPKRNEKDLIAGQVWVDRHSLLVRRKKKNYGESPFPGGLKRGAGSSSPSAPSRGDLAATDMEAVRRPVRRPTYAHLTHSYRANQVLHPHHTNTANLSLVRETRSLLTSERTGEPLACNNNQVLSD